VNVGRDLISRVTDSVMEDVRAWQQRPLDDVYPSSSSTRWCSKSARAAAFSGARATSPWGITVEGDRDVLGMWFQETEGAKFWMQGLDRSQATRRPGHPDLLRRVARTSAHCSEGARDHRQR
jgi:transposase-like protein